jgi:hypothetical protein
MESFANSMQIAMPLTDQAWQDLKPRLLAQREAAEQQEQELLARNEFLLQQTEERKLQEAQLQEAKANLDREWEESQKSVREKLEIYADNFIREQWQGGDAVTRDSCAQFAADMLLHVRHRFYNAIAQEDARMRAMGIPVPVISTNNTSNRRLTLENMRWVCENKIKPLTEPFQKELFLCNACDNHGKYYSLDSVVQHFAAKHTDSLSMGTAVVYWKADWPELPPFDPNPTAARASLYASANPSPALPPGQLRYNPSAAYNGYWSGTRVAAEQPSIYPTPVNGPFSGHRPSQAYESVITSYPGPASPRNTFHGTSEIVRNNTMHPPLAHHPFQPATSVLPTYPPPFPAPYPGPFQDSGPRPGSALSQISQNPAQVGVHPGLFPRAPTLSGNTRPTFNLGTPGQPVSIYQVQIQELANNAREVWNGTSGILDLPDSVRVQVIIHHVVLRFKDKYTNEPNLALFTDGLNNNPQMSPLRSLSGLSCKACTLTLRLGGNYANHDGTHHSEHRMHTLPAMVAHFQSAHVEHARPITISPTGLEIPRLDWKFDMIEMPESSVVRNLIYSPGITQAKLNLIATVLPKCFPTPLPQIEPVTHETTDQSTYRTNVGKAVQSHEADNSDIRFAEDHFSSSRPVYDQNRVRDEVAGHLDSAYHSRASPNHDGPRAAESPRDDEYDPHRPGYMNPSNPQSRPTSLGYNHHLEGEDSSTYDYLNKVQNRHNVGADLQYRRAPRIPEQNVPRAEQHPTREMDIEANDGRMEDGPTMKRDVYFAEQASQAVGEERMASPEPEPLNAAEQFLRSFDPTSSAFQEVDQSTSTNPPAHTAGSDRDPGVDVSYRGKAGEPIWVSDGQMNPSARSGRKMSPSDSRPTMVIYGAASGPVVERRQIRDFHDSYDTRSADSPTRLQHSGGATPDQVTASRVRTHLPPHLQAARDSPSRRPNSRFERYEAQRQESQRPPTRSPAFAAEPLPADDTLYREAYSTTGAHARQTYAAPHDEQYRVHPYADEIMYRRAAEPRQIRYIEDPRYIEPGYDGQVEYVRLAPREPLAGGRYYVQGQAAHLQSGDAVGYEPSRPHEQVFERNGRLYTRAPPSPEDYREHYARQVPYQ